MRTLLFLTCLLPLFAAADAFGQAETARLPDGVSVLPDDSAAAFRLFAKPEDATRQMVDVDGRKFAKALRIAVLKQPEHPWNLQLNATSTAAVEKGDVLLASFFIRCVEPASGAAEGHAAFVFETAGPPYDKSAEFLATADKTWRQVFVPFTARQAYAAGKANINFQLGFAAQTLEIGGITVVNYGKKVKMSDLPTAKYDGWQPDAPWRKAAAERIDNIRKAYLAVTVTDAKGQPVGGAEVSVKLTRHAFCFGSAVSARAVMDKTDNGQKYRDFVQTHFNKVVFENDLKWASWGWENEANRKQMFQALDWLTGQGIQVRGHCLVWPGWRNMPKDAETLKGKPAELRKRIADHVTDEVSAMKGKLVEWDVINEPYSEHDVMDVLGNEVMAEWFKLARAADPKVELFINDYSILARGGLDRAHQDHYEKTIRFLIDAGAPVDGVGMQGHFDSQLTPPARMLAILDRFAKLGKSIEVTEFDVNIDNERLQADFTRDFLITLFSHPSVRGILMWGFWEGQHWKPAAAMVHKDWTLKPNGQAWLDLVHKQWQTNEQGKTDGQGQLKVRGFLGEYEVTASFQGRTKTLKTALDKTGQQLKIALE